MRYYIWWLSQGEMQQALGQELPAGFPSRIEDAYHSMWGRSLRGRLWVGLATDVAIPEIPEGCFNSVLGRWLASCGGIVVEERDLDLLQRCPGTVTDFNLRRVGV